MIKRMLKAWLRPIVRELLEEEQARPKPTFQVGENGPQLHGLRGAPVIGALVGKIAALSPPWGYVRDQVAPADIERVEIKPPSKAYASYRGWTINVFEPGRNTPTEIYMACTAAAAAVTAAHMLSGAPVPIPYWTLTELPDAAR